MTNILTEQNAAERLMAAVPGLVLKAPSESSIGQGTVTALYGPSGGGKTSVAAGLVNSPHGNPMLYLDARAGIESLGHISEGISHVRVANWNQVLTITQRFKTSPDAFGYKAVVHDVVSEYANIALDSIHPELENSPQIQEWGRSTRYILHFIRDWCDIAALKNINVVFIFWDSDDKDDAGRIKRTFSLSNKLQEQTPGLITSSIAWVGPVPLGRIPDYRIMDLTPSQSSVSRIRRSQDDKALAIPYQIYFKVGDSPLADIINTIKGGEWPKDKYKTPVAAATNQNQNQTKTEKETNAAS